MPVLVWIPLLGVFSSSGVVVGLIASSVWQLARPLFVRAQGFPFPVAVAWVCAVMGLLLVEYFSGAVSAAEPFIPLVVVVATALLIYFSAVTWKDRACSAGIVGACFITGWHILHVWTIPLALPALLMGLFGFSPSAEASPSALRSTHAWRESAVGVVLGILPGLGPGLMGVLWHAAGFSPLTGIANLIFSVGFVALAGKVRSVSAEALAGAAWPWHEVIVLLLAAACIAWGLEQLLPVFSQTVSPTAWIILHVAAFVWWGNPATLGIVLMGWILHRLLGELHFPPSWGLLVLLPPIVWFYS